MSVRLSYLCNRCGNVIAFDLVAGPTTDVTIKAHCRCAPVPAAIVSVGGVDCAPMFGHQVDDRAGAEDDVSDC